MRSAQRAAHRASHRAALAIGQLHSPPGLAALGLGVHSDCSAVRGRGIATLRVSTLCLARGPKAMRSGMAARIQRPRSALLISFGAAPAHAVQHHAIKGLPALVPDWRSSPGAIVGDLPSCGDARPQYQRIDLAVAAARRRFRAGQNHQNCIWHAKCFHWSTRHMSMAVVHQE